MARHVGSVEADDYLGSEEADDLLMADDFLGSEEADEESDDDCLLGDGNNKLLPDDMVSEFLFMSFILVELLMVGIWTELHRKSQLSSMEKARGSQSSMETWGIPDIIARFEKNLSAYIQEKGLEWEMTEQGFLVSKRVLCELKNGRFPFSGSAEEDRSRIDVCSRHVIFEALSYLRYLNARERSAAEGNIDKDV